MCIDVPSLKIHRIFIFYNILLNTISLSLSAAALYHRRPVGGGQKKSPPVVKLKSNRNFLLKSMVWGNFMQSGPSGPVAAVKIFTGRLCSLATLFSATTFWSTGLRRVPYATCTNSIAPNKIANKPAKEQRVY